MRHLKKLILVSSFIIVLTVALFDRPAGIKVIVIDPISQDPAIIPSVVKVLDESGYSVTHIIGNDVTVERLKKLDDADVLILRVHSSIKDNAGWVFTGEKYDNNQYLVEQMTDKVHRARINPNSEYLFAVGSSFFESYLSVIDGVEVLVMGCDAAQSRELADVFLGKGASLYVSWDGPVSLEYTDLMFTRILRYYIGGKTMQAAVQLAFHELGADPYFNSVLRCFKQ